MTEGASLETWKSVGILDRELKIYKAITSNSDWKVKLFVYSKGGCIYEEELLKYNIELVYLHSKFQILWKLRLFQMIFSFFIPFLFKAEVSACNILKSNQLWGAWVPGIAAKLSAKKFLLRCGYESYRTAQHAKSAPHVLFIYKMVNALSYRLASRIHVASIEDKEFIEETYSKNLETKIFIYRNWVDTEVFKPQELEKNGKLLFIGRLTAQKNLHNLIHAVKSLGLSLDLVGSGELEAELKSLVGEASDKVQFLGIIPNEELSKLIPNYSLYVLVSHYEGTPKTLIEAMSCGAVCLGTDAPGTRLIIDHKVDGFLREVDSTSIETALRDLFADPEREQLGVKARKKILELFDFQILLQKELEAYQELSA